MRCDRIPRRPARPAPPSARPSTPSSDPAGAAALRSLRSLFGRFTVSGALLGAVLGAVLSVGNGRAAEPVRLTRDGRPKQGPVFAPGGRELIYAVEHPFNQLTLMRLRMPERPEAEGKVEGPEPWRPGANNSQFGLTFSADGGRIAYLRNDGNLHVRIVIEEPATGRTTDVDPGGGFAGITTLSWSPDGRRLAYAFPERGAAQQVLSVGADGQGKRQLTTDEAFHTWPRYSPDGRWLALATTEHGNFDVGVMPADGGPVERLTDHPGLDTHPAWSPDGRRLVYTSLRDGNYDLYVVSTAGGAPVRLTDHPEQDDHAVWSPDGRGVVFVGQRNGRQDLYWIAAPRP